MGIRFFGTEQVREGVIQVVGDLLGAEITPRKLVVRVRGYPIGHGCAADGSVSFRHELLEVFGGSAGDIRMVGYGHLPHPGLVRT